MKSTKITAPEGYEIDRDKSTFDEIVFKEVKNEFAQSWEELGDIGAYDFASPVDLNQFAVEDLG